MGGYVGYFNYFATTKYLDKETSERKGLFWLVSYEEDTPWQGHEASGHMPTAVRKQKMMCTCVQLTFFYSFKDPSSLMLLLIIKADLLSSVPSS